MFQNWKQTLSIKLITVSRLAPQSVWVLSFYPWWNICSLDDSHVNIASFRKQRSSLTLSALNSLTSNLNKRGNISSQQFVIFVTLSYKKPRKIVNKTSLITVNTVFISWQFFTGLRMTDRVQRVRYPCPASPILRRSRSFALFSRALSRSWKKPQTTVWESGYCPAEGFGNEIGCEQKFPPVPSVTRGS